MKGVILDCLKNLVSDNYGTKNWQNILVMSGLNSNETILSTNDFDDKIAISLIDSTCKVLNISIEQAADAFGEYWMNNYASKIYSVYISNLKSSKELLLQLDNIHAKVTKNIANARPPKFTYEWEDEKTLLMTYNSKRNLIDIFLGLAKGVAKYYKENLVITKIANDKIKIIFP